MYVLWNQSIFFFCFCLFFFILIHIKLTKVICLTRLHYKTSLSILPHCILHSPSCRLSGALWPGREGIKTWMKVDFFFSQPSYQFTDFPLHRREKKKTEAILYSKLHILHCLVHNSAYQGRSLQSSTSSSSVHHNKGTESQWAVTVNW